MSHEISTCHTISMINGIRKLLVTVLQRFYIWAYMSYKTRKIENFEQQNNDFTLVNDNFLGDCGGKTMMSQE